MRRRSGCWRADRTKNNKAHVVPLSKQALAELRSSPHEEGFLFSVNGKKPLQNWSKLKIKLDKLFEEEAEEARAGEARAVEAS